VEEGRAEIQSLGGECGEDEYMEKLPMGKRIWSALLHARTARQEGKLVVQCGH
jgi:hypothetical protein